VHLHQVCGSSASFDAVNSAVNLGGLMAGTAFLPWEKWLARLVHSLVVAIKKRLHEVRQRRFLKQSQDWPQTQGSVLVINWDSSCPREEILYSYSTEQGYQSGSFWHWFEPSNQRQVRVGDKVVVRYDPTNHGNSDFLQFGG
jgi:hypothetical protein